MKKSFFFASVLAVILFACSKSNTENNTTNNELPTSSETKAQFDNTSFGVYKGVIVGSSGYIIFRIYNGDNIVKGYLQIDNQKDTLTTTTTITEGQPLINVLFTGKISSMKVSANADGSNANLSNIHINGHNNVTGFILHEKSTKQVVCYEGTFNGGASGIVNFTKYGLNTNDTTFVLMKVVNDTMLYRGYGWTMNNITTANIYQEGSYSSNSIFQLTGAYDTINSNLNSFNGTWNGTWYGKGEFTTKRTY